MNWVLLCSEPQAWKRLISDTLSTGERVNLISSIFSDRKEVAAVGLLSGNNAQTFVDVMDAVNIHTLSPHEDEWAHSKIVG